ncbi:MAG TPA: helix-turn-helix domain-containing protein [Candidatus Dormibacteraeota bacterium]|nr:helix-turn-helix domain-containing protein [Candidatus Dormibacteraeota bacterium]
MQKRSLSDLPLPCPVARSLDVFGEWWSLLIVRDAFRGARRFEDFRALGAADNILSARLRKLVDEGIFEKRAVSATSKHYEYVLTRKGRDLMVVLAAIRTWGERWTKGKDATRLSHGSAGHSVSVKAWCAECDMAISVDDITVQRPLAGQAATGGRG